MQPAHAQSWVQLNMWTCYPLVIWVMGNQILGSSCFYFITLQWRPVDRNIAHECMQQKASLKRFLSDMLLCCQCRCSFTSCPTKSISVLGETLCLDTVLFYAKCKKYKIRYNENKLNNAQHLFFIFFIFSRIMSMPPLSPPPDYHFPSLSGFPPKVGENGSNSIKWLPHRHPWLL